MKLKFNAKEEYLVLIPFQTFSVGQPPKYVGRKYDPTIKGYPISEPYECEENTDIARRLIKLTKRDGSLDPADAYTAKKCNLIYKKNK